MDKLKVITYSSMGEEIAHKLIRSCSVHNYPISFIGKDVWFRDFRQIKIDLVLESLRTIDAEYVIYTDAPDSWFLRHDIFQTYAWYFGKDTVVVSGNRDHYPESNLYTWDDSLFPATTSFRYICSSQFIGPRVKLIELFELMQKEYLGYVDQEAWHYLYVKKLFPIHIDTECRLFLNMTQVTEDEMSADWKLKETGSNPCSIHFGGAKGESPNGKLMNLLWERWNR